MAIGIKDLNIELKPIDSKIFFQTPRNPEWEQMNKNTFFRRSAAYYFIDKRFFRIFYITSANNVPVFEIDLLLHFKYGKPFKLKLKKATSKRHDQWDKYRASSLNYDLSFFQTLKADINQLYLQGQLSKMSVIIKDSLHETSTTLAPIDVKIKYLRTQKNTKRKGSMICSKCYYYKDATTYKHFEWWFELNKRIGYNKITFCNSTIPNSIEYRNLFAQYESFIFIYQMQYLPNLLIKYRLNDTHNDYLTSFYDLKRNKQFYKPTTRVFDNIIFNECYLDNVDKYKYITIIDNDETILPRINSKLVRQSDSYKLLNKVNYENSPSLIELGNDLEKKCWSEIDKNDLNLFEIYVSKLKKQNHYYSDKSVYYKMGIYLNNSLVENIINAIESNLERNNVSSTKSLIIHVNYRLKEKNERNLSFKISNKEELKYARFLCKLYRNLIKEHEDTFKNYMDKFSNRFNRFLYVAGESTRKHFGKTVHSTDSTLQMIHHYPINSSYYYVRYEMGHVSHFRDNYEFNQKFFPIPIKDLFIDLNYFYCFYKPIMNKLISKN